MPSMIRRDSQEAVLVLHLEHGKANALDLEFMRALRHELVALTTSSTQPLVITGRGTMFSAGVDLFRVRDGGAEYAQAFLRALHDGLDELFAFPRPVVAAINGHAIAGGCILAAACDQRIMSQSQGRIGVTELQVGVPFPAMALEILRGLLAPAAFARLVLTGATVSGPEAVALGLVDEVVATEQVLARAIDCARRLAAVPAATYALTKRQLRQSTRAALAAATALDSEVLDLWQAPATLSAVRAFVERTVGRGNR